MVFGAFYAVGETLAPPGSRCFRHYPLSTFNYSLAKLYLAFVSVARFGGGRGIRRLAARGWASLLIGADLPKRMACGAFYTASETLAPPGRPQELAAIYQISIHNHQISIHNHQLSTIHFQLFICHALPCFIAIARFGDGKGLFGQMMACGAFYTASETLARPGAPSSPINYQLFIINCSLLIELLGLRGGWRCCR